MKLYSIILGVLLLQCAVFAQFSCECPLDSDPNDYIDDPNTLDNGLLECCDPNLTEYDFNPPIIWERIPTPDTLPDCYAALHSSFYPPGARWDIKSPYQGESFVVLSTGSPDANPNNDDLITSAGISQKVFLELGDTILGAFYFGTNDYMPFNDYGQIKLELIGDSNDYPGSVESFDFPGAYCNVDMVGNQQSTEPRDEEVLFSATTEGWVKFIHTVEPNQIGPYSLTCEVVDDTDRLVNSYYAIDGLRICRGGKPLSDLNDDCNVNLIDYSIFSEAWLAFCPDDPNNPSDPNIPCQLADIDNSWYVDPNDLMIMSDEWLIHSSI